MSGPSINKLKSEIAQLESEIAQVDHRLRRKRKELQQLRSAIDVRSTILAFVFLIATAVALYFCFKGMTPNLLAVSLVVVPLSFYFAYSRLKRLSTFRRFSDQQSSVQSTVRELRLRHDSLEAELDTLEAKLKEKEIGAALSRKISALDTNSILSALQSSEEPGHIGVSTAFRDGLISVVGAGLERVKLSVKRDMDKPVFIPRGTVFHSGGTHQNMIAAQDHVVSGSDSRLVDVTVACINYRKDVPGADDEFDAVLIPDENPLLLRAVLAICDMFKVDWFVRQCAVWNITDGVDPKSAGVRITSIKSVRDRTLGDGEVEIVQAIVRKANEVVWE